MPGLWVAAERGLKGGLSLGVGVRARGRAQLQKPSRPANESVQWRRYQARIDASRLVFIDETWTKTQYGPASLVTTRLSAAHSPAVRQVEYDVAEILAPTLRQGDLVMMDNLGSHKGPAIRRIIRAAGAKLFLLPKYSPDLNPIEGVFAKLKHLVRNAGRV